MFQTKAVLQNEIGWCLLVHVNAKMSDERVGICSEPKFQSDK